MAQKKHDNTPTELNKPYEENEIRLKGIFGFAIGLLGLIVVTFALMWALLDVLKSYQKENAGPANPMAMSDKERLPPEPRLQAAPGFGVDSETGRINLELMAPQSEYREIHKQWMELWERGQKDPKTGMTSVMSIEDAKKRFLSQSIKAKTGAAAEKLFEESRDFVSDSSAGRLASEKRR